MRPSSIVSTGSARPESHRAAQGTAGSFLTALLLLLILAAAPAVLGAARLWYELPLLGGIAFLLLVGAVRLLTTPRSSRRIDLIDLAALLFVVYAAIRWVTSPTEYFSRLEFLNIAGYATLFFTCRYGLVRRTHALAPIVLLVLLGLAEAAFGYALSLHSDLAHPDAIWFPFGSDERLQLYYAPRWLGTYGCPDHYAALLVMAIGATLALACFSKWPWPVRIVLFYLTAGLFIALLESASRGGWLSLVGLIAALTIFALRHGTVRWWVPVTGAVLLLAALGAVFVNSPLMQGRMKEVTGTLASGNLSNYVRIELDLDALRIARDHPFFGTGPATFVFVHPRYQSNTFPNLAELTHDDYLNCLDDYGLVGFALAMIFVWGRHAGHPDPRPGRFSLGGARGGRGGIRGVVRAAYSFRRRFQHAHSGERDDPAFPGRAGPAAAAGRGGDAAVEQRAAGTAGARARPRVVAARAGRWRRGRAHGGERYRLRRSLHPRAGRADRPVACRTRDRAGLGFRQRQGAPASRRHLPGAGARPEGFSRPRGFGQPRGCRLPTRAEGQSARRHDRRPARPRLRPDEALSRGVFSATRPPSPPGLTTASSGVRWAITSGSAGCCARRTRRILSRPVVPTAARAPPPRPRKSPPSLPRKVTPRPSPGRILSCPNRRRPSRKRCREPAGVPAWSVFLFYGRTCSRLFFLEDLLR